jgi:hypothetical protein
MFYLTKLVKVIIEYIYIYRKNQVTSPTMKEKNPNFIQTMTDLHEIV